MTDLVKDISVLTDVTENTLNKFIPIINYCIGHAVHEADCTRSNIVEIDLGYGELHLKIDAESVAYRFIPSRDLEKIIVKTLTAHNSPIIMKLETNLQERLEKTYKELI